MAAKTTSKNTIQHARIWLAILAVLTLTLAACSSEEFASESSAQITSGEASTEAIDEIEVDSPPEDLAQEPVTATTVHESSSADFPDIIAVQATPTGENTWRFDVTVSSPYDTAERYADAWRIIGPDGTQYGIRELTHDHASEQPFTRSQSGIVIPAEVTAVIIEGRDLANGWGGGTLEISLG